MCLHLTARFAWHDGGWDGRICRDPSGNIYCNGNFSLLSSRIQRRKNVELEKRYAGRSIDELTGDYIPPCYWVLNALGSKRYNVKHVHPFCDFSNKARESITPIDDVLESHAIFTWCFKFSFSRDGLSRYPRDLEERLEHYLSYVIPGKSLVIFYCNYSNPVNGDRNRYLILGAALVKGVKKPKRYAFDPQYYAELKKRYGEFPVNDWAFQVVLDPESIVMLPYHEYLERMKKARSDDEYRRLEEMLGEIVVEVDNKSIEPFFKYVSMHISTDNALYILYRVRDSLSKAKKHGVVDDSLLDECLNKIGRLIEHLWSIRGRFSSLKKALLAVGRLSGLHDIDRSEDYKEYKVWESYVEALLEKYGDELARILEGMGANGIDDILNKVGKDESLNKNCYHLLCVFRDFVYGYGEMFFKLLKVLCSMDLSYIQICNVLRKVRDKELDIAELLENPYSLVYNYVPFREALDEWFIEFMDPGIPLHIVDIALIPDPEYVHYSSEFPPNYPGRIVAAIYETLLAEAVFNGVTAVNEDKLLELMAKKEVLRLYRGAAPHISRSDIERLIADYKRFASNVFHYVDDLEHGRIFQLRVLRLLEKDIENCIGRLLEKRYTVDSDVCNLIDKLVNREFEGLRGLNIPEGQKKDYIALRRKIYARAVKNGLLVIKGSAGTGKTEAIVNLVELFLSIGVKPIFVLTPTGKSALVVESRLKDRGLAKELCYVATIHRFLYSYYFELIERYFISPKVKSKFFELVDLIDKAMGDVRWFNDFRKYISTNRQLRIKPAVVIVDEASMVDELVLALLFNIINMDVLAHLIIVGDYNQLPPIGLGKPFVDIVNYLEENDYHENVASLDVPVRFSVDSGVWAFSQAFASVGKTVVDPEVYVDDTLEVLFFESVGDLKDKLKEVFQSILGRECSDCHGLLDILNEILGLKSYDSPDSFEPKLEYLQILTPTRYGEFGSDYLNKVVILDNRDVRDCLFVKVINERNRYERLKLLGRQLVLANGSIGYWSRDDDIIFFEEIDEIFDRLERCAKSSHRPDAWSKFHSDENALRKLLFGLKEEFVGSLKDEVYISPSYAITVHKSQGSDFDYVLFVMSRVTDFVSRELFYTASTRAKRKLFLLLNVNLKGKISQMLQQVAENSEIDRKATLLFKYRVFSTRTYSLKLDDGTVIHLRSKVEYMIAEAFKSLGLEFEYEPKDFVEQGIVPDFKIRVDDQVYYVEHLGLLDRAVYRSRWNIKKRIYEKLGLMDRLITVSEPEEGAVDVKSVITRIVDDIRRGCLKEVKSGYPSKHHYVLASSV